MVAISMYRGDLHGVSPELPRQWLMPARTITLKEFRSLLHRRSKALSVLSSSAASGVTDVKPPVTEEAVYGNPNLIHPDVLMGLDIFPDDILAKYDDGNFNGDVLEAKVLDLVASLNVEEKEKRKVKVEDFGDEIPFFEGNERLDNADDNEKHKMDIEEKLKILTERKHNLVQALKQILNAEEELKRRACLQAGRPPLPSQTVASNDFGSMTRHATPRTGSEANITDDVDGREGDGALNQNPSSRLLLHMSSTSPSA